MELKERFSSALSRERLARSIVIFIVILSLAFFLVWGWRSLKTEYQRVSQWMHETPPPVAQTNKPETNAEKPPPAMEPHAKAKASPKTFAKATPPPQPSPLPGAYPSKKRIIERQVAPRVVHHPQAGTNITPGRSEVPEPPSVYLPLSGTQGSLETRIYGSRWKTPTIVQIEGVVINHDDTRQKLIIQDSTAVDSHGNPLPISSGFGEFKFGTCNHNSGGNITQLDPEIPVAFCIQIADADPQAMEMNLALYFYWERAPASYTFASIPIRYQ